MRAAVVGVVLVAVAVTATGCSDGGSAATDPTLSAASSMPSTPTPTPTPEVVLWAGAVCVARDQLLATIGDLAMGLEYDPQSPDSVGEQFQSQVEAHMDEIDAASSRLGTALGGVPLDYVEAAAALTAIQEKVDRLTAAKDTTMGHVTAAQGAGDPVSAGLEWLKAAASAKDTYDAGTETLGALQQASGAVDGDVSDAFATAPECR